LSFHPDHIVIPIWISTDVVCHTAAMLATEAANASMCDKSKRGVIIVDQAGFVISSANNYPPRPFQCYRNQQCHEVCNKVSVHAEERAILTAIKPVAGAEVVHAKTVRGKLVPSGPPSCWQCSRMIVEAEIGGVWLYHEDGWKRYDVNEFHRLTLENCGLV
jgi:deoxycytidylate deaminase